MKQNSRKSKGFNFPKIEEEVLAFWDKENIFQKSLDQTREGDSYVFFEGPPTANGRPGIHHVLARAYKDIMCRYKTMRGFFVERKAGWDTHGLPVELQVEKALGISGKPDIEKYGIEEFNKKCKESVWEYQKEWEQLTRRLGFWLDLENPYITYDGKYIESLWWIIKQIWDKDLMYKGHKVVPHCSRCGTALSSHEVAQGYQSVEENSVYIKFKVVGEEDAFILSWTTTPWTLPGNVALAVGESIDYVKIKSGKEYYYCAKAIVDTLDLDYEVVEEMKGAELVGKRYEPLFSIPSLQTDTAHRIYAADFVNTEEGTGIVHTAVMYGEDDYQLGEKVGLPKHHTVTEEGLFTDEVPNLSGQFVKDKETEKKIIQLLSDKGLLLSEKMYTHDYPFCWRCDTPLLYYAKDSWFIRISGLRDQLIKNNQDINWVPGYIKDGRFGEWLNEIKDWAFSRERYWGTPLPIWESETGDYLCVGSFEELKALAKDPSQIGDDFDPHRPFVDDIILEKDGVEYRRVKEVADVWFDSGSMPFAQWHYPFENKDRIDKGLSFPAQYISEAIDQTRGWFYTLLAVATLLDKGAPYHNVVCLGHILDANGQKMSKSRGNVVDPFVMMDTYGADTVRWHLFTMNQPGDTKLFDEKQLVDVTRKNWMIVWNVLSFYKMFERPDFQDKPAARPQPKHILDKWILARLYQETARITGHLEAYGITEAGRALSELIDDLSTWYIRRSRDRFKQSGTGKEVPLAVLRYVLVELSKLLAPFAPFISEALYREVRYRKDPVSVHLAPWPSPGEEADSKLLERMKVVRQAVELGHSLRKDKQIKVRQPLSQFILRTKHMDPELQEIIRAEMNVDEVILADSLPSGTDFTHKDGGGLAVALDTTLTDELKERGIIRDITRHINAMRKDAHLTIEDTISVYYDIPDDKLKGILQHYKKEFCSEVLAQDCFEGIPEDIDYRKVLTLGDATLQFGIKKQ